MQPTFHCRCQPSCKISSKDLNPRLNYNNLVEIQYGARPLSSFPKTWFLINGSLSAADFPSWYQIRRKNVDRRRSCGPKSKFEMAAFRHLEISKTGFLSTVSPWAANFPSPYEILRKNVDRSRNYGQWRSNLLHC